MTVLSWLTSSWDSAERGDVGLHRLHCVGLPGQMLNCLAIARLWVGTRLPAYARVSVESEYRMVAHKSLKSVLYFKV